MTPAFFDALVGGAAGEAEARLWEGVLRDCFAAMKGFDFAAPEKHAGALRRCGTAAKVLHGDSVRARPGMHGCSMRASGIAKAGT